MTTTQSKRQYAKDDNTNARLTVAAEELNQARAMVRKAKRELEAATAQMK